MGLYHWHGRPVTTSASHNRNHSTRGTNDKLITDAAESSRQTCLDMATVLCKGAGVPMNDDKHCSTKSKGESVYSLRGCVTATTTPVSKIQSPVAAKKKPCSSLNSVSHRHLLLWKQEVVSATRVGLSSASRCESWLAVMDSWWLYPTSVSWMMCVLNHT